MLNLRVLHAVGLSVALAIGLSVAAPGEAREGSKTLKLYFGHTKERGEFTFKRNGRYDKSEIKRVNQFLRDWRRNEPANMDPQLLDLVWAIYRETGSKEYIHVVSAYRSLTTNNMLRSRSKGVAKTSQHTAGKAMDFYIPGVPLAKLRATAMKFQGGGVGYYPTSGSPFVHVDTGNVRSWPRMSRQQLLALFPNGETLYLPTDGKPLAGYEKALARRKSGGGTALAYLETGDEAGGGNGSMGGWLKRVFDGGADQAEDAEIAGGAAGTGAAPAALPPASTAPAAAPASLPVPFEETGDPTSLIASLEGADQSRLPRPRPGSEPEVQVAAIIPETIAAAGAAAPLDEVAAIDVPPVPRSRPDSVLLSGTLEDDGLRTLEVETEDAIAALAVLSGAPASAEPESVSSPAPVVLALAAPDSPPQLPAKSGTAIAAATALVIDDRAPAPRPRPFALAFAGSTQPTEAADAPVPASASQMVAAVAAQEPAGLPPAVQAPAEPASKGDRIGVALAVAEASYSADEGDLRQLIGKAAARRSAPTGFTMPQPAGSRALFVVPANAAGVTAIAKQPGPPIHRFNRSETDEANPGEKSFFSRLFASLAG